MMVVVVDVDLVAIPFPIAAAVNVVGRHHPIGAVVQHDVAGAVVDGPGDKYFPHMLIMAARVVTPGGDAVVLVVPAAIIVARFLLFPTFMLAIVVAVVATIVLVFTFMFAVIVPIVAILARSGRSPAAGQR